MNYVYLLKCSDGTLYAGWTTDIVRRVAVHNRGQGARYTRGRLPVQLVYWEECASRSAALRREAQLKKLSRAEKQQLAAQFAVCRSSGEIQTWRISNDESCRV